MLVMTSLTTVAAAAAAVVAGDDGGGGGGGDDVKGDEVANWLSDQTEPPESHNESENYNNNSDNIITTLHCLSTHLKSMHSMFSKVHDSNL